MGTKYGEIPLEQVSRPVSRLSMSDAESLDNDRSISPPASARESRNRLLFAEPYSSLAPDTSVDAETSEKPPTDHPYSTKLHRSGYMMVLTLFYAGLATFAWSVTCILVFRPITALHYGVWIWDDDNNGYGSEPADVEKSLYAMNLNWYRAARVVQSIVGVLTIPLTSALCSSAAVIYVQQHQNSFISMRKVMTLADRGWVDPAMYVRLLTSSHGFRRYGSSFLLIARLLNILGGVISPLQEIFLSNETIQTPTWPTLIENLVDIPNQWSGDEPQGDPNLITILTRKDLESTTNDVPQSLLWQGASFNCSFADDTETIPLACSERVTLGNMSTLSDPFLAQLPSGYSTGLIRQFLPRFNSTAKYENIAASQWPANCGSISGSLFVQYANSSTLDTVPQYWGVQACMPADMTKSPWKPTRARQDFSEQLYLNVTLNGFEELLSGISNSSLYKATVNTTAGYFELPNYMNNQVIGPLLADDPTNLCGSDCEAQGFSNSSIYDHNSPSKHRRQITDNQNSTFPLERVINKGPLLTTALALFGEGSFLDVRLKYPDAYSGPNKTSYTNAATNPPPPNINTCMDLAPLGFLLADSLGQYIGTIGLDTCISNEPRHLNEDAAEWLSNFLDNDERMTNAFSSAAFLANQNWVLHNNQFGLGSGLNIQYDLGSPSQKPNISMAGLILISALLGLDLVALLTMALYTCWHPRWTGRFDSFAMMRFGAANADKVPLMVGRRTDGIKSLDEMSGFVGDGAGEEKVGRLALGAGSRLRGNRRYQSYEGDNERPTWDEQKEKRDMAAARKRLLDTVGVRT